MSSKRLLESRVKGCLLGQAVGDALGTRYEFSSSPKVHEEVAADKEGAETLPILGWGPFRLIAGQVTDDTELAMGLARSLTEEKTYDRNSVASSYHDWFCSKPFDMGTTTRKAFGSSSITESNAYEKIAAKSAKMNMDSLSNGCLMRVSPLGIAGTHWDPEKLREIAKADCRLTNPNPITQDAVSCFVSAIQTAILTGHSTEAFESAVKAAETEIVADLLEAAKQRPNPVKIGDTEYSGDKGKMGYFGVAFQGAFYELLHANSFETGLERTVLRGGDTDTNGCITGALLGACLGHDKIPLQWRKKVMEARPRRLKNYPTVEMSDAESLALELMECKEPEE